MRAQRSSVRQWTEKVFMSHGFRVNTVSLEDVSQTFGRSFAPESYGNVVFVAEQLRFSDDQVNFILIEN